MSNRSTLLRLRAAEQHPSDHQAVEEALEACREDPLLKGTWSEQTLDHARHKADPSLVRDILQAIIRIFRRKQGQRIAKIRRKETRR